MMMPLRMFPSSSASTSGGVVFKGLSSQILLGLLCLVQVCEHALSSATYPANNNNNNNNINNAQNALLQPDIFQHEKEETRLLNFLMKGYDKNVRPVIKVNQTVQVHVGITLTQIFDMDEKNQVLTTNVWLDQEWNDMQLSWDPKAFGGIERIRIPCDKIWLPDIVLYNNADDFTSEYMRSLALVKSNGDVFWPPPTKFRSTCPVNVAFFPFDDQVCQLKLGSWLHDGFSVNVTNRTTEVDLSNYVPNGEWQLMSAPIIVRHERYYNCCVEPFPEISISLKIRRKTLYYMYNIVFPCMMMSTLTVLVFCLPPDSGEKIALGVTVLLAFSVFMLAIAEKMPETSESIPLIGIYLTSVMAITCVSVIMTVTVLNFFYRGPTLTHVPEWVQKYILHRTTPIRVPPRGISRFHDESMSMRRMRRGSTAHPIDDVHGWGGISAADIQVLREVLSNRNSISGAPNDMMNNGSIASAQTQTNNTQRRTRAGSLGNTPLQPFPRSVSRAAAANGHQMGNGGIGRRCPLAHPESEDLDGDASIGPNNTFVDIRVFPPSELGSRATSPNIDRYSEDVSPVRGSPGGLSGLGAGAASDSSFLNPLQQASSVYSRRRSSVGASPRPGGSSADLERMIEILTNRQREDEQINEILKDWKMLAQKLDYFLFWIFLVITSFTSFLFIFYLPYHNRGKLL